MKKLLAMLLVSVLALSTAAFAATYNYDNDITFQYDENNLEITFEEHKDDEDRVILGYKNDSWGDGYITIQVDDLPDNKPYPTDAEIAESLGVEATQLEKLPTWGNFTNVITVAVTTDGLTETMFIAPVIDDDGEAEEMLTVVIATSELEDEAITQDRDDAISAVVDTLKVDD